jgi:HSP20 family protein
MYYNQACAAKGAHHGSRFQHQLYRSSQRAPVNIYRTDTSFEMLIFAPGRIKEHFHLDVKGNALTVSYTPPQGFSRPNWILREYSRGSFERTFSLDTSVDTHNIIAKYEDGVLQVSLPVIPGKEAQEIKIS